MSKDLGLDAASLLAKQKARIESGVEQIDNDSGFIAALDDARLDIWDVSDVPLNINDTEGAESEENA